MKVTAAAHAPEVDFSIEELELDESRPDEKAPQKFALEHGASLASGPAGASGLPAAPPVAHMPGGLMRAATCRRMMKGIIEGDSDPDSFISEMMLLCGQARLFIGKLIKTYPLSKINRAMADRYHRHCVKVVILTGHN